MGFEVYLAVDEFSWSKKPQPHMIRRQIVNLSIAGDFHIHLFPNDIPVNPVSYTHLPVFLERAKAGRGDPVLRPPFFSVPGAEETHLVLVFLREIE